MIGAAEWEWATTPEWRTTVEDHGWFRVYACDDPDRVVYSGPCQDDAEQLAEWERARARRMAT